MAARQDATHQALDITIGRIIEMYLNNEIDQGVAQLDLARLFEAPHNVVSVADIQDFIHSVLGRVKRGAMDSTKARLSLVSASVASHRTDDSLKAFIHTYDLQ